MTPETSTAAADERFTSRLEAFSDLVFGFSLSLVATRLDVPAKAQDIFASARWFAVIGTFGFVCRFWLEHYRIFRHRFVASMFDACVNFVFLFAIAILPYAVQTFLRFGMVYASFGLYLGDFVLILSTLAILRLRGLRQRRDDPDLAGRLHDWRRTVLHALLAALFAALLVLLYERGSTSTTLRDFDVYLIGISAVVLFAGRRLTRRLPRFLVR
jgi:uncharacterized membrane protein